MSSTTTKKIFTRTIWMLSFVSLFNDIGSEMLIPVMPIYLKTIGFTALWIGILEGLAEAIVGVSKGYFGKLSDERGRRLPFVQLGYLLSNISKPLMTLFISPIWVLFIKSGDKLGKGIRTSARDAMLSDECSKENKGKVFGLHRAMDTCGAAIGPSLALIFLFYYPAQYKSLFLFAFIPGMIAVSFTFLIKEKVVAQASINKIANTKRFQFFSYFSYWKKSSTDYKKIVIGLLLFTLFNSSDVFLLLMAKQIGFEDLHIIGVYIFYNLVYALFSFPIGAMADKIGIKTTFIIGLILFAIVYVGMAFVKTEMMLYALFFIYGIYAACTDGVSKAWIAKISPKEETATALGFYASFTSIATMLASFIAGILWVSFSPATTFIVAGTGVVLVIIYFLYNSKHLKGSN
jgi:MFS family permease